MCDDMVDDTLTARNRINQRNFRARRQNYIRDLEERLRKYESDGVQATIEIQTAARQVTEQNIKLRALLMSRYGLNDHEIETYLNSNNPVVPTNPGLVPASLTSGIASKPADLLGFAATASFQSTHSSRQQSASSLILSPALGLASLHRGAEQNTLNEPPSKKQRRELVGHIPISELTSDQIGTMSLLSSLNGQAGSYSSASSSQDRPTIEQDLDTLSESSNPHTPADQHDGVSTQYHIAPTAHRTSTDLNAQIFGPAVFQQHDNCEPGTTRHNSSTATDGSVNASAVIDPSRDSATNELHTRQHRPGDETACEDAARIIASMRGTNDRPEQILLELGCGQSKSAEACKIKNLSIFSLMDSRD